jgi:hypothetical protein
VLVEKDKLVAQNTILQKNQFAAQAAAGSPLFEAPKRVQKAPAEMLDGTNRSA